MQNPKPGEPLDAPPIHPASSALLPSRVAGIPTKFLIAGLLIFSLVLVGLVVRPDPLNYIGVSSSWTGGEVPQSPEMVETPTNSKFLRWQWDSIGPKEPLTFVPLPQITGQSNNSKIPIVKRRATTVSFPGRDWRHTINHLDPLVRKLSEIRQAREYILHQRGEPRFSNRYRYLTCTMTRNEPRLKEWLIRSFMSGMEHIVVYDNNRISTVSDHNITEVLAPFVTAGIVTHERWPRQKADLSTMTNEYKFELWEDCIANYGAYTDWFIPIDTDEHLALWTAGEHPLKPETFEKEAGLGSDLVEDYPYNIFPLHEVMAGIGADVAAFTFPWLVPYNEHLVLQSPEPLLTTFGRNCVLEHSLHKIIYRPNLTWNIDNHWVKTNGPQLSSSIGSNSKPPKPGHGAAWIHYYGKSVEEWLWKKEQSYTAWHRSIPAIYDSSGYDKTCGLEKLHFPPGYVEATMNLLELSSHISNAGHLLRKNIYPRNDRDVIENSLYLFMKYLVEAKYEWHEQSYLDMYPWVAGNITNPSKKAPLIDGLHHFLRDGYRSRHTSCWMDTRLPQDSPLACFPQTT